MNIVIFTYGSRGDFEPFLALAVGLQKAGHTVSLAGPHRFASFAAQYQVPFVPLAGDPEQISRLINDAGANGLRVMQVIKDYIFSISGEVSRAAFTAAEGADLLIHSFLFTAGIHSWAREHRIPDVSVQIFPVFAPTRAFPNPAFAYVPPGLPSYLTHWMADNIMRYGGNSGYKPDRVGHPEVSFPARLYWPFRDTQDRARTPLLFAFSPSVLPRPCEWGGDVHVPGYFFLEDTAYQPPEVLTRFLEAGPAPVCVTFGSMINRQSESIHAAVVAALLKNRQRAIFLAGWGASNAEPDSEYFLHLESVPHTWLFSRCQMIIHHGGAGTTAAGLRAGIPNIVIPHTADQPFWGKRVWALGVGPAPIPVKKLTAANLAYALRQAGNPSVLAAAENMGRIIRTENGVSAAIGVIEETKARFTLKNPNL